MPILIILFIFFYIIIQKKINNSLREELDEIIKILDRELNNIKRDDLYAI